MNKEQVKLNFLNSKLFSSQKTPHSKIRLFLVDDQDLILEMLRVSIEPEIDLKIIGTAKNGQTALKQIESLAPDLVIVDIEMPDMNGLELTQTIIRRFPKTKVLLLSSHDQTEYIKEALKVGAKGYLLKTTSQEELVHAIRFINMGYLQLAPGLFEKLTDSGEIQLGELSTSNDFANLPILSNSEPTASASTEEEWSDSTQQLLDTLPRVWTKALLYLLAIFTAVVLPWAMLSKVDEIGTAKGRLEPKGKTIRLDAPVSGTVIALLVREGDRIQAGQKLLELESNLVKKELEQQQYKLAEQTNRLRQLELFKNQLFLTINTQQQQNQAQKLEKQAQVEQAQQAIAFSQAAYKLAKVRLENAQEKIPRYRQAFQDGVIDKDRFLETKQLAKENRESQAQAASELTQAQTRWQEQQQSYDSLVYSGELAILKLEEQTKNLETQISTLKTEIAQTKNQIKSIQFQLSQRVIQAPIKGTIFQLPIAKPGAVVQTGQTIAQIAPQRSPLVLRAQIDARESGFLRPGLPVKVKFDAYPFQDFGVISGRLSWISPDSKNQLEEKTQNTSSEKIQQQRKVFEVEIELNQPYIQTVNQRLILAPGQTATAEVVIRQRRVIDLFIAPFKGLQKNGLNL